MLGEEGKQLKGEVERKRMYTEMHNSGYRNIEV